MFGFSFFGEEEKDIVITNLNQEHLSYTNSVLECMGKDVNAIASTYDKDLFVINFDGDSGPSNVDLLAKEVSTILSAADPDRSTVLVTINSSGGTVNGYGLAASQLERIRDAGIELVVSVDLIAASGGYMMAVVADKIIASKNAIIGSIGVVSEFSNVNGLLKSVGVEFKQYTAGESKRTVSPMSEITEEGERRHIEGIERIYDQFCKHVSNYREVDLSVVATGKTWSGLEAKELNLIDHIETSESFIFFAIKSTNVIKVEATDFSMEVSDGILDRLFNFVISAVASIAIRILKSGVKIV